MNRKEEKKSLKYAKKAREKRCCIRQLHKNDIYIAYNFLFRFSSSFQCAKITTYKPCRIAQQITEARDEIKLFHFEKKNPKTLCMKIICA